MKIFTKLAYLTYVFATLLSAQQRPIGVCGLPPIGRIAPNLPVVHTGLAKASGTTFRIRKNVLAGTNDMISVEFTLLYFDAQFEIYGEAAQIDSGRIDSVAVEKLVAIFKDRTFSGSIDSSRGIKAINEEVFGTPPDIDGDGKMFILLLDIRDDFEAVVSETFVAGYFDPLDQTASGGNHQDIIYIDIYPASISGLGAVDAYSTLAHEYQHLIHFGQDVDEETWVDEGLSELSPVLMGLPHRAFSHYLVDTNQSLTEFEGALGDYARTALFFFYSWVQLGTNFIKDLVLEQDDGLLGFSTTLGRYSSDTMSDFVKKWHIANFVNGAGETGYRGLGGIPAPVMHNIKYSFPAAVSTTVQSYGAHWTLLSHGADLKLSGSASRSGSVTLFKGVDDVPVDGASVLGGTFTDLDYGTAYNDLYVLHVADEAASAYSLSINASGNYEPVTIAYDDNIDLSEQLFISLDTNQAVVSFDIPLEALDMVSLSFVPFTSARAEVRYYVGQITPSSLIDRQTIPAAYRFEWVDYIIPSGLAVPGKRLYIGITTNAMAYNEVGSVQRSYLATPNATATVFLGDLTLADGRQLTGNWSIRATYLVSGSPPVLVAADSLIGQFYSNPFHPSVSTGESVNLDVSFLGPVRLTIYNLSGQEVWSTVRGEKDDSTLQWSGIDGFGRPVPSGLYIGIIQAGDLRTSRKMVLIR